MKLEDISINSEDIEWQNCLQHWAWLLKKNPEFNIWLVTKFAEVFVSNDDGSIWFLSTSNGSYEKVANSKDEFASNIENDEKLQYYFMPQLIHQLESSIGQLGSKECYGFLVPGIFKECEYNESNFKITNIETYLIGLGDMLGELETTPNGQKVSFNVVS